MEEKEKEEIKPQSYNTKELAGHYQVSPKVFRRWISALKPELGTRIGNYYNPEQVKIIFERLGRPVTWIAGTFFAQMFGGDGSDQQGDQGQHGDEGTAK